MFNLWTLYFSIEFILLPLETDRNQMLEHLTSEQQSLVQFI